MHAGPGLDKLCGNAHAVARPAHRAFEHIAHTQFAANLLHIDAAALVGEARIAGDHKQPPDAAECGDDLLDHTVGKIFLLRIAAHIGEGQHRDRWLVGQRQRPRRLLGGFLGEDTVNEQRPRDVLEALLAEVVKLGIDFAAHLAEGVLRDADAAGLGDAFEPSRDVDAIAVDVAVFDNDVAEVHSDPEGDPLFFRCPGIAFGHPTLEGDRTGDGLNDAREFDEDAITGCLDDAALVFGNLGVDEFAAMGSEPCESAGFVLT